MIAIIFLLVAGLFLYRLLGGSPPLRLRRRPQPAVQAAGAKITDLTEKASRLRALKKYSAAEKAYLQILKIDHRHTATYSRLGTLYVAMKNPADAMECFQIATQLSPDGPTFYNLGLALYDARNLTKSVAALEKSVMFEPSAKAYVALAKVFNRTGEGEQMLAALERAVELDPEPKILWLLVDAYQAAGRVEEIPALHEKIRKSNPKDPRIQAIKRPRKPRRKATPAP